MKTREDVVEAIQELLIDLKENSDSWENPTLDRYLDAMAAWLQASGRKQDEAPSWDLFIEMLQAAKLYE